MSCAGCSIGAAGNKGTVSGCGSGGCATGGCNRLNTYDWLTGIPAMSWDHDPGFVEVSFKNGARKDIFRKPAGLIVEKHDPVAVEVETGGYDIGQVSLTGEMAKLQMKRKRVPETAQLLHVIRVANDYDMQKAHEARVNEKEVMVKARAIARSLELNMKIGDVEFQGDGRKATFYYTADDRVDFRELIRVYAKEFRVKIEMHQIGARQEAGRIGGIGSCGRELCCSTWLTEFKSVTTAAARYQNLAINQVKLSGQCGRLKCCLNYELDTYIDALKDIPTHVDKLETDKGILFLQKTDIFKRVMFFAYKDHTGYRPLTVERVLEIQKMNAEGVKIADQAATAAIPDRVKKSGMKDEDEVVSADLVGQTSLRSLEKHSKKKKAQNQRGGNRNAGDGPGNQNRGNNGPREPRQPGNERQPQRGGLQREPRNAQPNEPRNTPQREQRNGPPREQRNRPPREQGNQKPREPRPAPASGDQPAAGSNGNQPQPQRPNNPRGRGPQNQRRNEPRDPNRPPRNKPNAVPPGGTPNTTPPNHQGNQENQG